MKLGWSLCLGGLLAAFAACGRVSDGGDGSSTGGSSGGDASNHGGAPPTGGNATTGGGGTGGSRSGAAGSEPAAGSHAGGAAGGSEPAAGAESGGAAGNGQPAGGPSSGGGAGKGGAAGADAGAGDEAGASGAGATGSGGASGSGGTSGSGGGFGDGKTLHVPADYSSIQSALDVASDSDVVLVAPGTYHENLLFNGKATLLLSAAGPAQTVIDGSQAGPVVEFDDHEGPGSTLEGFTLRNGSGAFGGGVTVSFASPTIRNNVFEDNSAFGGAAAIGLDGSSSLVERNLFRNNSCDTQLTSGVVSVFNTSGVLVQNNVFIDNDCRALSDEAGGTPEFANNTFANNSVAIYVTSYPGTTAHLYRNNLVFGGGVGLDIDFGTATFADRTKVPRWDHNLVFGSTQDFVGIDDPVGTSGNLTVDPQLIDVANGNLHLRPTSLAIDAGAIAESALPELDFDGDSRVIDGDGDGTKTVDIGAFEFH